MIRRRRKTSWELVVCGRRGHALVGTDAAQVRDQDRLLAREQDGVRWHRCLRCDGWVWRRAPENATRRHLPDRQEIEIPERGQALRDKLVLRLIAVDRVVHVVVLTILGVAVLALAGNATAARGEFDRVMTAIQGGVAGGPVQTKGHVGIIHELDKLFSLRSHTLHVVGIALLAYAVLEAVEAVGLWRTKRWAEYLTFIATTVLLPLEIYEIASRASVLKIIGFLINLAIVVYLIWAKRLFGLRGGGAVDERRRAADMSWEAVEQATPPALVVA